MVRLSPVTAAAAVLVASAAAHGQSPLHERAAAVADSSARALVAAGVVPSVTVALAHEGRTFFAQAYGLADVEMSVPASPQTVYKIRSLTKQFTAAAVLRLVERGKLGLDEPITTYLPDFPTRGRTVTVRHLLNHTSGLTTKSGSLKRSTALGHDGGEAQWHKLDLSYAEMVHRFGRLPFEFEPGTRYEYNNFGYYLLGEIIGRVTGTPYPEFIEREMLRPLGLDHTWYCDDHRLIPGRAEGYEYYDGRLVNAPYMSSVSPGGAAGALCGAVGDLIDWTWQLHSGQVVSPASLALMTTRPRLADGDSSWYGMGLYLPPTRVSFGHRKIYHGGARPGFGTYLAHYPEDGLTIAVLTNAGSGRDKAEEIEAAIARAGLGEEPVAIAATAMAAYEGHYALEGAAGRLDVRVFVEDGRLMAQLAGRRRSALVHRGNHRFVIDGNADIRLVFGAGAGRVRCLTVLQGNDSYAGMRK